MPEQKWFGREPALVIQTIAAVLAVAVGFGFPGLNDTLVAAITAFLVAAAATWTAIHVQPVAPAVFTGVIASGATLLAAFGLHLSQQQVSLVTALAATIVALIARQQLTPVHDPSSSRL